MPRNKGWSEKNILKCKTIGDRAGAYVWLCNHTSESYEHRSKCIQLGIITFTFIISIAGIPSIIWEDEAPLLKISAAVIAGMVGLLGFTESAVEWIGYPKSIKKHGWASSQYANQFMDIERTLSVDIKSRARFSKFYQQIKKREFSLQNKTPYIPPRVFKAYYKTLGTQALRQELLFGDINIIDIYVEEEKPVLAKKRPAESDLHSEIKKSQSQRHRLVRKDFQKSKGRSVAVESDSDSSSESSSESNPKAAPEKRSSMQKIKDFVAGSDDSNEQETEKKNYHQAKKLADRRRYELDRYFIDGDF